MPASPADSAIYRSLLGDDETAQFFTDSAEIRAMLLVEGALAQVQGGLGLIPAEAAAFIDRAAREVQIDPASLAAATARNGVPVPGLLAAFRKAAGAEDLMQYLHWGATSQDIMDTALMLRLRRVFDLWEPRLGGLVARLGRLALTHADLPMVARTYGQAATPTGFGAVVAAWGWPLLGWRDDMPGLRQAVLQVSLSGAAGTLSAMGPQGAAVRAGLAQRLYLADPGHSWHSDRSGLARLAGFAGGLAGSLGKLAEDLTLMAQSDLAEIVLADGGGSSTMPQKQNPVGPSALLALCRTVQALAGAVQATALHRQQRDGAAWFAEWLVLPQLCILTGRALRLADEIVAGLAPDAQAMQRNIAASGGFLQAEMFSFALAEHMPRPQAQEQIKALCRQAVDSGTPLEALLAQAFPAIDWPSLIASAGLGQAPADARAFARRAAQGGQVG